MALKYIGFIANFQNSFDCCISNVIFFHLSISFVCLFRFPEVKLALVFDVTDRIAFESMKNAVLHIICENNWKTSKVAVVDLASENAPSITVPFDETDTNISSLLGRVNNMKRPRKGANRLSPQDRMAAVQELFESGSEDDSRKVRS